MILKNESEEKLQKSYFQPILRELRVIKGDYESFTRNQKQ